MKHTLRLMLFGVLFCWAAPPARAVTLEWIQQLGTSALDQSYGVSADGLGNVYIGGASGETPVQDAFVAKYNAAGNLQWTRRFGTSDRDEVHGVSADGFGNVYISGWTDGSLAGPNPGGFSDAFLAKYDATGNRLWMRQFGTFDVDFGQGVATDGLGNIYISGYTHGDLGGPNSGAYDTFLAKYDAAGNRLWLQQLGTSGEDQSWAVSADRLGNVYISGHSWYGSLVGTNAGRADAFVAKYDAMGSLQWTREIATAADDQSFSVSADGLGNVYFSGSTGGSLFLVKYEAAGNLEWTRQIETSGFLISYHVSADGLGNVYISGATNDSLGGPNAGNADAFVAKYDATGNRLWTRQLGTFDNDVSYGASSDGVGNVYITGDTQGSLGGPNAGNADAFVAKYSDSPGLPGDFNDDSHVDGADYVVWRKGLTSGAFNQNDFDVWRQNFGATAAGAAAAPFFTSIPEPSGLSLATVVLAALMLVSDRRRPASRAH